MNTDEHGCFAKPIRVRAEMLRAWMQNALIGVVGSEKHLCSSVFICGSNAFWLRAWMQDALIGVIVSEKHLCSSVFICGSSAF
jgi:hypothetical protein